jgi:hypothetical protein
MSNEKRPLVVKRQLDQIKKHLNKPAEAPSPRPTVEEVETVDEARVKARISLKAPKDWKPKAEKTAAASKPKKEVSSSESDSEAPGIYGQLLKHKDLRGAPKIKFENGQSHEVSPAHRDKVLDKFRSLHGAGKSPDARDKIIKHAGASHENFMQHVNNTYTPEKRHPMSAVKEDQDIVEKLQKALEDGVLSQNDFDKLTQAEEVEAVDEKALVGKQKKLDKNHNGKLDAQDFKMIRKEETVAEEGEQVDEASKIKVLSPEKVKAAQDHWKKNVKPVYKEHGLSPEFASAVNAHVKLHGSREVQQHHGGADGNHPRWFNTNTNKVRPLVKNTGYTIKESWIVAEEAQTPAPERHYVTPATEANRFRGVESSIREIMSQNRDIRKIAKEEEFNRNK